MASKRRLRRKAERNGCRGKTRHKSEADAQIAVCIALRKSKGKPHMMRAGFLHPYKCQFCGAWHIGNSKSQLGLQKLIEAVAQ